MEKPYVFLASASSVVECAKVDFSLCVCVRRISVVSTEALRLEAERDRAAVAGILVVEKKKIPLR